MRSSILACGTRVAIENEGQRLEDLLDGLMELGSAGFLP